MAAYAAVADGGPLDVVVANAGVQLFGQDARVGDLDLARLGEDRRHQPARAHS